MALMEVFNSQEIFVHLQDYRLRPPDLDEWKSIKDALAVWLNCWFSGEKPEFKIQGKQMHVNVDGDLKYQIRMVLEGDVLEILCTEEGQEEMNGDKYPIRWRD